MTFKVTQYTRGEQAIHAADGNTIRERWLWGLRLLRDSDAMTPNGNLHHGIIERLVTASAAQGINLSEREIQRRLTCAKTYPTEEQIRHAVTDFGSWHALVNANFRTIKPPPDATPGDHRTRSEKQHDAARALSEIMGEPFGQEALFPLAIFEPTTTTLKELREYVDDQWRITRGFIAANEKREAELTRLLAAVNGDENKTWLEAHQAAGRTDDDD